MSLPRVNRDVCASVAQSVKDHISDKEFLTKELKSIKKENPIVAEWVYKFSKKTRDFTGAMGCAVILYNLLKSQDEANELKNMFSDN